MFKQDLFYSVATVSGINIAYYRVELFWKPLGAIVQFVLTRHPTRGNAIVMSTDLSADPVSLMMIYGLRFKIEVFFKQAVHTVGTFLYRFWLKSMSKKSRKSGDQVLQFSSKKFKESVAKKIRSYHLFIQAGFIAHGLLQYLSMHSHQTVWKHFGTWIRAIRGDKLPSEMIVAKSMTRSYFEFLVDEQDDSILKKFIREKTNPPRFWYEIPARAKAA